VDDNDEARPARSRAPGSAPGRAPGGAGGPSSREIADRLRETEREIYARRPEHQLSPTLDRIAMLVSLLGDPHRAFPVIHVTGTNGKTSMARMIESLLRERGLRTGRFTSPHLVSARERIAIDGAALSAERFIELYDEILPYVQIVDDKQPAPLSFFEVLTGMMFAAFADAPVDVAVIEVGLGGRWDATNVADGTVAVIGPVAMDHMEWLGDTIEDIAREKAGIIKPGATAILAQQRLGAATVLLQHAAAVGASVAREGIEFGVLSRDLAVGGQRLALRGLRGTYEDIFLPLFGAHQAGNAACALAAVEAFAGVSETAAAADGSQIRLGPGLSSGLLDPGIVRDGFAKASSPGRLEVLRRGPTVLADAAHNPAGMAATAETLTETFGFARVIGVVAVSADKDVSGVLAELEPVLDQVVVTANSSPRSMAAPALAAVAREIFGEDRVVIRGRLDEAIEAAVALADEQQPGEDSLPGSAAVLITGSVVTAGDARALLAPSRPVDAPPEPGTPARHAFTLGDLS
jgi:folylpolyglutamate synthase/dihydrofolate synthase